MLPSHKEIFYKTPVSVSKQFNVINIFCFVDENALIEITARNVMSKYV